MKNIGDIKNIDNKYIKLKFKKVIEVLATGALNIFLVLFSLSCVFPIVWLVYSSFKDDLAFNSNVLTLPKEIHLDNYIELLTDGIITKYMLNSLIITLISIIFIISIGFIAGYFIARFDKHFKSIRFLSKAYLVGMLIPIHALLVPIYIWFNTFNLVDKSFTLILPYVSFGVSAAVFLIQGYIRSIPRELEEAAAIDGSSLTRTMFSIIFPLCIPILATVGLMQAFVCWNEYSFALTLISSDEYRTLPLGLTLLKGQYIQSFPRQMTLMAISMFPIIVLYLIFNKQIIKGMLSGALKG